MLDLYQTPLDFLYLVLTLTIAFLGLFVILAIYHLIRIMANIRHVTEKTKETIDLVNHYLWQPIRLMMEVMNRGKDVMDKRKKKDKDK